MCLGRRPSSCLRACDSRAVAWFQLGTYAACRSSLPLNAWPGSRCPLMWLVFSCAHLRQCVAIAGAGGSSRLAPRLRYTRRLLPPGGGRAVGPSQPRALRSGVRFSPRGALGSGCTLGAPRPQPPPGWNSRYAQALVRARGTRVQACAPSPKAPASEWPRGPPSLQTRRY
jgi:hypothetical protein